MTLKGYVRNRARPEGCIVECYLVDECMAFCNDFIKQKVDIYHRGCRNEEFSNDIILEGRPLSVGNPYMFSNEMLEIAHLYVLFNSAVVEPYMK